MTDPMNFELECVDPPVGEHILELSRPGLDPDQRRTFEAHLAVCAHCRQAVDLERRLAGAFGSSGRKGPRRRATWMRGAAVAAAAAAAFCMFALPPRPVGPKVSIRGVDDARFVRPVEGEVVGTGALSVRWTEVPGADAYSVRLDEVDGTASWTGSTTSTTWSSDRDVQLVAGRTYRLTLSTVPADLLTTGATSVRFEAGTTTGVVAHRATRAPLIAYGLAGLALLLALFPVLQRKKA